MDEGIGARYLRETRHGRKRTFRNAPRTLDLDLLLYDGLILREAGLTLPHPRMCERSFVLQPLAEVAPEQAIPGRGRVADCLAALLAGKIPGVQGKRIGIVLSGGTVDPQYLARLLAHDPKK